MPQYALPSTLNAATGKWKWHTKIAINSLWIPSQITLVWFTRMLFGLKNAPGTFSAVMDIILSSIRWQFVLVYLDDIVIFSKCPGKDVDLSRQVLTLSSDDVETLKMRALTNRIDYLGHVIKPGRMDAGSHTNEAIRAFQATSNINESRFFHGLRNMPRCFLPYLAQFTADLNCKLQKPTTRLHWVIWRAAQFFAYLEREACFTPMVLLLPRSYGTHTVDMNACARQVGCVLLQKQPHGHDRPIGY